MQKWNTNTRDNVNNNTAQKIAAINNELTELK